MDFCLWDDGQILNHWNQLLEKITNMKNQHIILLLTILSFLLGQEDHDDHDKHGHHKELSIALGVTPAHDNEDSKISMHVHYIKGLGNHSPYALGISLETIFDKHKHNSVGLVGLYRFESGFSIAYVPGLLFVEHENDSEMQFAQHLEVCYEFEYEQFHLGPQIAIGIEEDGYHYSCGIHLGIDF